MTKHNMTSAICSNCNGALKTTRIIGLKRISLFVVVALLMTSFAHGGQFGWPPMFGAQQSTRPATPTFFPFATQAPAKQVRQAAPTFFPFAAKAPAQPVRRAAPTFFPFATQAPAQPVRQAAPGFSLPWFGGGKSGITPQWGAPRAPAFPFGAQSGISSFSNPMTGFGGFGNMGGLLGGLGGLGGLLGGLGGLGMIATPVVGIAAPMMTKYAISSMNPTTMSNFFGLMSNQGGGMMPFGGGFSGGGFGASASPFPFMNIGSMFHR